MKQIDLKCGIQIEVADNAMDNMELLDALSEMADNDVTALSKVITLLIGKDQRKTLYNAIRTDDGRVPVEAVSECIQELFTALGEKAKN